MLNFITKTLLDCFGLRIERTRDQVYANRELLEKASNPKERFREVISDPLNLAIERVAEAGFIDTQGLITLHNGIKVPISGKYSYYGAFSELLIFNRGVHEPLEEYCFQQLLKNIIQPNPVMLELGAYWSHYSMWLKKCFPLGDVTMVEPETQNILAGQANFKQNQMSGCFINEFVGDGSFVVDKYISEKSIEKLTILHSDIQGFEFEMLQGALNSLQENKIDYLFVSSHGDVVHRKCIKFLIDIGYRIEINSEPLLHTTSHDGFIFASSPDVELTFLDFEPMGRVDILKSSAAEQIGYLGKLNL